MRVGLVSKIESVMDDGRVRETNGRDGMVKMVVSYCLLKVILFSFCVFLGGGGTVSPSCRKSFFFCFFLLLLAQLSDGLVDVLPTIVLQKH